MTIEEGSLAGADGNRWSFSNRCHVNIYWLLWAWVQSYNRGVLNIWNNHMLFVIFKTTLFSSMGGLNTEVSPFHTVKALIRPLICRKKQLFGIVNWATARISHGLSMFEVEFFFHRWQYYWCFSTRLFCDNSLWHINAWQVFTCIMWPSLVVLLHSEHNSWCQKINEMECTL